MISDTLDFIPLEDPTLNRHSKFLRDGERSRKDNRDSRSTSPFRRNSNSSPVKERLRRISPPSVTPPPASSSKSSRSERPQHQQQHQEREMRRITYDNDSHSSVSSSSRSRHRSRSPVHNDERRRRSGERGRLDSNDSNHRSVFARLGSNDHGVGARHYSPPSRAHQSDYNIPPPIDQMIRERENLDMRIIVHNDNYHQRNENDFNHYQYGSSSLSNDNPNDIIYRIKCLEEQSRDNIRHIDGIKFTVENYQREIAKLERIVLTTNQEIERLKSQLNLHYL